MREAEYGDELHLTIFQEDEKQRYIYQLELNGEEYLSYHLGFQLAREQNIFIVMFIFCLVLLVNVYLKIRISRVVIDDIQK